MSCIPARPHQPAGTLAVGRPLVGPGLELSVRVGCPHGSVVALNLRGSAGPVRRCGSQGQADADSAPGPVTGDRQVSERLADPAPLPTVYSARPERFGGELTITGCGHQNRA